MRSMKKRQRKILMKRLECDSKARQVALSLGLLYFKGKSFVQQSPFHAAGVAALGMFVLSKVKNLRTFFYGYKQARLLIHSTDK